ncbi:MAG: excinuclease ABC subunit UvrC [bacterium]
MSFDHKRFLKQLTQLPGVYQMFDDEGALLYVGKAKNLRKRVGSYFRKTGLTPKTEALVERIGNIQVTVTETEVEALILEQNLIKQGRPPFNVMLRDDKSYPYIYLSDRDRFPRLALHRGTKRKKGVYFGPYPSVGAVRESLNFLQKTFKVRQCEDSFFKNRSRPCLQYQIKRCSGPCVNLIDDQSYSEDVRHTRMFLEGKSDRLISELDKAMDAAAADRRYEDAASFRDQMIALRQVQSEQVIESGSGNLDVIAAVMEQERASASYACVHVLYVRQGRILGSRSYYPKVRLASGVSELLEEFIPQMYLGGADIPAELVVSHRMDDAELLEEALSQKAGRNVKVKSSVRSARLKWLEIANRTAGQNLNGYLASKQNLLQRFESLRDALGLDQTPERLECFDISHSAGEATVASCVVFDQQGALKSDYRRFNISEKVVPGDDYGAMAEALTRRYTRIQKGEGKLPDILFIDGGKGQLRKAKDVLDELGVIGVTAIGVSKGTTRKPGFETLLLAHGNGTAVRETELDVDTAALLLIQNIRDEAHRFAISGHRQRRDKKRKGSLLDGIPGVGATRRRELLRFFGGLKEVERASVSELMRVPKINRKVAEAIYSALHNE